MTEPTVSKMLIRAPGMAPTEMGEQDAHDRHTLINGWNQDALKGAKLVFVGVGGLGGETLEKVARLGANHLVFCDFDTINLHNMHTQPFYLSQRFQNKAFGMLENLKKVCTAPSLLEAYPMDLGSMIRDYPDAIKDANLIVCLVDNDETRRQASEYGLEHNIPVIFAAVSRTTLNGYVFIQNGRACFNCINSLKKNTKEECREPSVIYIHTAIIGIVTYAVVSLLMNWNMSWNFYELFLDSESRVLLREKRVDCEICKGVE
ncbi:MAG: hypothetical protein FP824_03795 [Euryarchaeota archaeon]|nr:hypothetical protein [Euryarchaeota archaeon]MBU4031900.1 ThiF family adenylyltransferase [Candidatus Thermoplasmatota archaeon]MBU4143323.1 ThiF family adenylyltransferase [Candidatus Thermoplasmatota archaeon]